jgi:lipopolysaccharide/colanic/teichoic acid biosynthesis glycosyltransferase
MARRIILFVISFASVIGGMVLSPRYPSVFVDANVVVEHFFVAVCIAIVNFGVYLVSGVLSHGVVLRRFDQILSFIFVAILAHGVSSLVFVFYFNRGYGRYVMAISFFLTVLLYWLWYHFVLYEQTVRRNIVLIGEVTAENLEEIQNKFLSVTQCNSNIPQFEFTDLMRRHCKELDRVTMVIMSSNCSVCVNDLVLINDNSRLECIDKMEFFGRYFGRVPIDGYHFKWVLSAIENRKRNAAIKRSVDLLIGFVGVLIGSIVLILIYLGMLILDRGRFIYTQTRLGLSGRLFTIYKIRTMKENSENGVAMWAKIGDARVTRIGKLLRKTRLDEIPQFYNILNGTMSFIGPRPERKELADIISQQAGWFGIRNIYKPGLTGWAQVNYRYGASINDGLMKLEYDMYYIKNWSLFLDVNIFFRTILAMVKGAR